VILAGDVGGTKTDLALFEATPTGRRLVRGAVLPSRDFASLESAIEHFLTAGPPAVIEAACVGVPGPVVDGRATATNLAWHIDERALAGAIPAKRARLLNDLEATGYGVLALPESSFAVLQAGIPRGDTLALIAAGTGLGQAMILRDGGRRHVIASEGGHVDFAPRTALEDALLVFLRRELGRVSYERVVSGPGLWNIYRFLREGAGAWEAPTVAAEIAAGDPGTVITAHALAGTDALCAQALEVFVAVYGAEAGNLALKTLALRGVVLAGGIAPRILPLLVTGGFLAAFRDKGRLAPLMADIPVRVVLDPSPAVLGAAVVATELLSVG
jgi:glucokinase